MTNTKTLSLTLIALMTAITCILGPISIVIPISPVPVSFTNLAIYLTVMILGQKKGIISCMLYLLIGFAGVPVFSSFTAGPAKLLGPTGGYLIGFIFMAMVSGYFIEKFIGKIYMYIIGMIIGTTICYAFGTTWLSIQSNLSFSTALITGVIPYLPGDATKILIATFAGTEIRKRLVKANLI